MLRASAAHILLLESRVQHLDQKIIERTAKGEPCSYERAEHSALVAVLRELRDRREAGGVPWPHKSELDRFEEPT